MTLKRTLFNDDHPLGFGEITGVQMIKVNARTNLFTLLVFTMPICSPVTTLVEACRLLP
jgi:uncharacterized membrane protein